MTTLLPAVTQTATLVAYPPAVGYPRARAPRIVLTEPKRCLAICGTEAPGGPEFQEAMGALYGTAYSIVHRLRDRGLEARVKPSEALWERRNGESGWSLGAEAFDATAWTWTLLIPVPPEADEEDVHAAILAVRARKANPALDRIHLLEVDEGVVVEAMHVGPYADEPRTIEAMRVTAEAAGMAAIGPHHEIYLGDPFRTAPQRLRTVLRQPVRPARLSAAG
jgi:hypothetical protein